MRLFSVCRIAMPVLLAAAVGGCASKVPAGLNQALPQAPSRAAVQAEPERYLGQEVRWGGEILGLHNRADITEVEVYGRDLHRDGEPKPDQGDGIRFIARVTGFLDPARYQPGRRITARGPVGPLLTRPVGEYPYRYPQVIADLHHLWPVYQPPPEYGPYHDPFYGPWGPWGPWYPWGHYRHPYWW